MNLKMPENAPLTLMKYLKPLCLAALLSVVCLACKSKAGSHLPPKVMQKVLMDLNIAEAYSTLVKDSLHKAGTKNSDSLGRYYTDVLGHYKITQGQFTESLNWYKDHPTEMDSMYTDMLAIATRMQSKNVNK